MALAAVLFSLMNFFARIASETASWATVGASRALMGALIAASVARVRGVSLRAKDKRAIFWRSFFGTASMLSTFYALSSRTLSLGDTATLLNLSPVFLAVLAPIALGERTSLRIVLAIGIALTGVVLVVHPTFLFGESAVQHANLGGSGPSSSVTAAVAVFAACSTSIAMMLLRRVGQRESAEAIALHFSLFAAAVMLAIALVDPRLPDLRGAVFMVLAGTCAGFGQLTMTRAYSLGNAAPVSAMNYLSVVTSALLGAAVLQERPTTMAMVGMLFVVTGGVIVTLVRPRMR